MQRHVLFYSTESNLVNCLNWLCGKSLSELKLRYIIIGSFVIGELFFFKLNSESLSELFVMSSIFLYTELSFLQKKTIIHNLLFIILTLVHLLHYSQTSWCTWIMNIHKSGSCYSILCSECISSYFSMWHISAYHFKVQSYIVELLWRASDKWVPVPVLFIHTHWNHYRIVPH